MDLINDYRQNFKRNKNNKRELYHLITNDNILLFSNTIYRCSRQCSVISSVVTLFIVLIIVAILLALLIKLKRTTTIPDKIALLVLE